VAERVPIPKHPGFWRRGDRVVFKYRDHRRRQRWGSAPTIQAAKNLRAELETDVRRGEYRARSRDTFADYARSWVATYQGRTSRLIQEHTRADYAARLEHDAIPYFEGMMLTEIEPQDLKAFAAHVAGRGVKANTVRLALAPVKALFATAFEEGKIRVNPAAGIRIAVPRPFELVDEDEGPDRKALSEEQLVAVLEQLDERWRLFFLVLVQLGLRIGELLELRWRDVDLGAGKVKVRRRFYRGQVGPPKTKYGRRTLSLTVELRRALWAYRKSTRAGDSELVFTAARGRRVDGSNLMSRVLKPAAVEAGIGEWIHVDGSPPRAETWVGFHTFRHTCATLLFGAGWNPKQVQLWLGHHKASFTVDTYVHLLDEDLPEPPSFAPPAAAIWEGGTSSGTQSPQDDPRSDGTGVEQETPVSGGNPASAMAAKIATTNS
jgi:integrase